MGDGPPTLKDLSKGKLAHEKPLPEPEPPRDIGKEARDTLQAQIDLAPQEFAANALWQPQYAALYQQILDQGLFGQGGQGGLLDSYGKAAPIIGDIQSAANTQQRLADIGDVEQFGGRAVAAFNNANPELAALRSQMALRAQSGAGASMINAPAAFDAPQMKASLLGNAPQGQAQYNNFTASPYERVTAGPNAAADAYSQRAISDLALGGSLGAGESRNIQNDVLARFNRSGRSKDPAAIAATALGLDEAQNARLAQRQGAAATAASLTQGQNVLGMQAGLANQGAGLQQQGYGLQASLANQQAGNQMGLANLALSGQYGLSNQQAQNQAALANQQAGLTTGLANQDFSYRTSLANQQAQLANEQLQQQRMMQAAQFLQSSQIDPFQAILGRSGSLQGAMAAGSQGANGATYSGSGQFDPFSAYAADLYNTNFNAGAANNISAQNNAASNRSAMIGGGVSILAAFL